MSLKHNNTESNFMIAAMALDTEFQRLSKLAQNLEALTIDSDKGLERGIALMKESEECRAQFGKVTENLALALNEAQANAAKAVEMIATRAAMLENRQQTVGELLSRYKGLAELVRDLTAAVSEIRDAQSDFLSSEARQVFASRQAEFDSTLSTLVDHAKRLMDDARVANVKDLVRHADSLRQSLQTTRHRFGQLAGVTPQPTHTSSELMN